MKTAGSDSPTEHEPPVALILAAGEGRRLRDRDSQTPKPLTRLRERAGEPWRGGFVQILEPSEKAFANWGRFVVRRPGPVLITTLLLTAYLIIFRSMHSYC